ncbi:DUF2752 domain-containing protein [Kordia zhangzhouensis]|uniref:DUF2752 domain-containing protein n=1 Tax=Kordia zhangzhouensis TaxID=1620405 RepID=UPI001F4CFF51|nr:DUF2752 domain-containing protein [Kordia zhangzhouensis]
MLSIEDYMLPCLTKQYFGFDCFGCGIQRALALIMRGELVAAFKMYPAIYTLLLFFGVVFISIFYKFNNSQRLIRILAIINILIIIINFSIKHLL